MRSGGRSIALAGVVALALGACTSTSNQPGSPASNRQPVAGAVPSPGCHEPAAAAVTNQRMTIPVDGVTRQYLLTAPRRTTPAPLVVDFHGYGEGDQTESLSTQFGALGLRDGFIAAFPQGTGHPVAWDISTAAHWNSPTPRGNPDLRFVGALLNRLEATRCVDEARIYATGLSMGAFMTSTIACTMSSRFAAVAPVAGVELPNRCHTSRPVPLLAFHGTADPILHFNGGLGRGVLTNDLSAHPARLPKLPPARLNGPGYPATVKAWARKDGCRDRPTDAKIAPHVIHRVYPCPAGVAVEFDIILGGGHSWPGSAFDKSISRFVGHTTSEINATDAIWAFFQRFRLSHVPGQGTA